MKIVRSSEHKKSLYGSSIGASEELLIVVNQREDTDEKYELQYYNAITLEHIKSICNDNTQYIHTISIHDDKIYFWKIGEGMINVMDVDAGKIILTIGDGILESPPKFMSLNRNEIYVLDRSNVKVFNNNTGDYLRCIIPMGKVEDITSMQTDDDNIYFLEYLLNKKQFFVHDKEVGRYIKTIRYEKGMSSCGEDKMIIIGNNIIMSDIMNKKIYIIDKHSEDKVYEVIDDLEILEPLVANSKKIYMSCYHDIHMYDIYKTDGNTKNNINVYNECAF
jgi:hypothetical protein